MTVDAYAGLRRRKQTPWTVKFGDAFASKLIAVGGIGTIAAIMLVVLVLFGTAWPLFQRPTRPQWRTFNSQPFTHVGLDENDLILWGADSIGKITAMSTISGAVLAEFPSPATSERQVTASHLSIDCKSLVLGFSDGSFQVATINFQNDLLNAVDLPAEVKVTASEPVAVLGGQVYKWFDAASVRRIQLMSPQWSEPRSLGKAAVKAIDYLASESSQMAKQSQSFVLAVVEANWPSLLWLARKQSSAINLAKPCQSTLAA